MCLTSMMENSISPRWFPNKSPFTRELLQLHTDALTVCNQPSKAISEHSTKRTLHNSFGNADCDLSVRRYLNQTRFLEPYENSFSSMFWPRQMAWSVQPLYSIGWGDSGSTGEHRRYWKSGLQWSSVRVCASIGSTICDLHFQSLQQRWGAPIFSWPRKVVHKLNFPSSSLFISRFSVTNYPENRIRSWEYRR